jgi:peptidoglycan hydrolase-like amidase
MSQAESKLIKAAHEPLISIGLMEGPERVSYQLKGEFVGADGVRVNAGNYRAAMTGDQIEIVDHNGKRINLLSELRLAAIDSNSSFLVRDVVIGIDFHWQRRRDQVFRGILLIKPGVDNRMIVINQIPVESYLTGVISSEMSPTAHPELLKAHAIISRSWLLAQMKPWKQTRSNVTSTNGTNGEVRELIRWYDQESHRDFDVCADDHCQRYQGFGQATSPSVFESIRATFGQVLTFDGVLCDTRFSKSCGGMTESYDAAWENVKIPYLAAIYDGESFPSEFKLPLSDETNATEWIRNSPPAFCRTEDRSIIGKILPDFDRETMDFYRWDKVIDQEELQELLRTKLGIDFGVITRLEPVQRGESGRIVKLKITGERESIMIGKELEIRRALSSSHLYSSAFIVETYGDLCGAPKEFKLRGAGWGHGVGLCQIGAALMAERGYNYRQILAHYYHNAQLSTLYTSVS